MAISNQIKTLSYLTKARPFRLEKPIVIQFPVIDICNSQCQMCRIWENSKSDDIKPETLRRGLRNPLYSEVRGVGLNGGEPTLRKDLGELAAVLFEELPKLRSISLITNAYRHEEVIARIGDVGEVVRQHGGLLDVMVSLDGYGEMHDRVRGKPGNFERAQKVIAFLQTSPLIYRVRIGCTIIKENVYGLADLFEYCLSKGLYIKYRLGIPHQRLYTQNLLDPYALSAEDKYHVAEFLESLITHYETDENQVFFYRSLIDQIIHHSPRKAGCDWQHRGATITSKGELLYCAVQSKALGRIDTDDSELAYFGNEDHLREILSTKCGECNHDYVGIPPRRQHLEHFARRALRQIGAEPLALYVYQTTQFGTFRNKRRFTQRLERMMGLANRPLSITRQEPTLPHRVLICGWYGTETLGDKAILGGVIHAIHRALDGAAEFTLVSLFPYVSEMTRRQMVELKTCRVVDPQNGVLLASGMDLVVFGGGPLMALDELADMEAIFTAARKHKVPTLLAGCGVGPLGADWHNASLRKVLSLASFRIYRDTKSRDTAGDLGTNTAFDLAAEDPAFTWLRNQQEKLQDLRPPEDRKVLLLGLREFPSGTYARHLSETDRLAAKQRYERAVIDALEQLAEQHPDLSIRPLPMCTNHFGDDDRWFYRRLFRGNTLLAPRLDLSLLGPELPPLAYCKAFRSAHAVLTMRFHSLVFALGLDTPAIAIDYTLGRGKVHSLAQRFDVPHQALSELEAEFIVREINQLFVQPHPQAQGFDLEFEPSVENALRALMSNPPSWGNVYQ